MLCLELFFVLHLEFVMPYVVVYPMIFDVLCGIVCLMQLMVEGGERPFLREDQALPVDGEEAEAGIAERIKFLFVIFCHM